MAGFDRPAQALAAGVDVRTPSPVEFIRRSAEGVSSDAIVLVLETERAAVRSAWVLLVDAPGGLWRTTARRKFTRLRTFNRETLVDRAPTKAATRPSASGPSCVPSEPARGSG
ncbi:MAG: hypothetical protein ACRDQ5_14095 [Sciscionella sp.]